mmetsp:Transcript_75532/g.194670  ORF Transcript_75532/g.194670 Transcript_75532/m.194670 type:complete len:257 (-) Transcript_75532:341-1111(-)
MGRGEGLRHAALVEDERHPLGMLGRKLQHDALAAEPADVLLKAVHARGRHLGDLVRVQPGKARRDSHAVERLSEAVVRGQGSEVDEGVPDVALIFEVDREVQEVVLAAEVRVQLPHEHLTRVLVRDVAEHRGAESWATPRLLAPRGAGRDRGRSRGRRGRRLLLRRGGRGRAALALALGLRGPGESRWVLLLLGRRPARGLGASSTSTPGVELALLAGLAGLLRKSLQQRSAHGLAVHGRGIRRVLGVLYLGQGLH